MDALARHLSQFLSLPAGEKIQVLLVGSTAYEHLQGASYQVVPDEATLSSHADALAKRLGTMRVDSWIATISDIVSGLVITPDGFPGRVSFPIFPLRSANKEHVKPIQYLERDKLRVETFLRYFGLFKKIPTDLRPRIVFASPNLAEAEQFFAEIHDTVDLYRIFPDGLERVKSGSAPDGKRFFFDYLKNGSTRSTAKLACIYPDEEERFEVKRSALIKNYFIAMAKQMDNPAFSTSASRDIRKSLRYLDGLILKGRSNEIDFLLSAKIQLLLLRILVDDDDKDALYESITLSKAIENQRYETKCLRFINQTAGVSSYAIDQLNHAVGGIHALSRDDAFNPIHLLEYYAASQNLFVTRLFNQRKLVDAMEADDCLQSAEDQCKYFNELGMLANAAGLSYLCSGMMQKAEETFRKAASYSSDRLTNLNIMINLLISRKLLGAEPPQQQLAMIFHEYKTFELRRKSQYHAAMAFGNLWHLTSDGALRRSIEDESRLRGFISNAETGGAILPKLRSRGFLFMKEHAFGGPYGDFVDHSGFMPAFHFNWSTPVTGLTGI
jgi:hypothetical protein